jgi:hypothetical protein
MGRINGNDPHGEAEPNTMGAQVYWGYPGVTEPSSDERQIQALNRKPASSIPVWASTHHYSNYAAATVLHRTIASGREGRGAGRRLPEQYREHELSQAMLEWDSDHEGRFRTK